MPKNKTADALPTNGETDSKAVKDEKTHRQTVREVFQDAHDARVNSLNNGTTNGLTQKVPLNRMVQKQEGPAFSTANAVLNSEIAEPKTKTNKTKDSEPTTGEKGDVAKQNEKSHRQQVHGVFGDAHEARIPSGNTGQLKSRSLV